MKKYKIGTMVYEWDGVFASKYDDGQRLFSIGSHAMSQLIADGIATEVREPIVGTGMLTFNHSGYRAQTLNNIHEDLGLTREQVSGRRFSVVATEIITQESDKT